jgi:tRNA-dihydrouridine synthase A
MANNAELQMGSRIAVAPMMDWTDRHCRYFMRLLSPSALLYTEMITAAAIHHGDAERFLRYTSIEHPIAVQLGGSDPVLMVSAARQAADFGYDEININVGCPSDRVQSGQFGACLMNHAGLVADCFSAMQDIVDVPVTIKTRIGIDDQDSDEFLWQFVTTLAEAGCRRFIVHARIAILGGLSPKENRSIPPLNYARVFRLKRDFPELEIVLNGGVTDLAQVDEVMPQVDGVMIGRQAYHQPYFLAELEQHLRPDWTPLDRHAVVEKMMSYAESELRSGESVARITRHMMGLFAGLPGARAWRRHLSENAHRQGAGPEVLQAAIQAMRVSS